MHSSTKKKILCCGHFILFFLLFSTVRSEAGDLFPLYDSIKPNVRFWEDVYGRYTTRQGILHDRDNLAIVYTVVDLVDWRAPGSARINRQLINLARERYKNILTDLAAGEEPVTTVEKRVASLFPGTSHQAYDKARNNIRLQIGQKDRFLEGVIISGAYMPAIKKIFKAHNLPPELAYLPHVESSFNLEAHSKAGAAGIWQFTNSTGKQYMTIDSVVDERLDPFLSSQAAALFLKGNYKYLESWPLAITAYNYGRPGMIRAKEKMGDYENIFNNHQTGLFKFACRNFYPEFLAALQVARKIEADPSIAVNRPEAAISVRMNGYARAHDLLNYFKIDKRDFARLNPSLKKPVLEDKKYIPKNFLVRLPAHERTRDLAANLPQSIYRENQIRDGIHVVQRGDTVGSIALKYRTSLAEIIQENRLDSRATIRIGQKLKIPAPTMLASNKNIITLGSLSKKRPR
ncbi:MAG: transglycosylase SLT domain-containing protein [Desulfobulbaceae bacterium]|nr:transglycosylase SLT domain-containing protein [Desulfobulbaceae bacterium]